MSFSTPSLDDRTFQQLVDEAKLLIPKHAPEWTNHNLSDPGVAIIELFAWMTEQVLYRLNQVPERLYLKFLEMVGVAPYPAQPARADLTFWLSASEVIPVTVPRGTQVGTQQTEKRQAIVFMTDDDLLIRQPILSKCLTSEGGKSTYNDAWDDLQYDKADVTCFTTNRAGDAIYFGFEESAAANVLYLEVTANARGIGIEPDKPPLAWEAWDGEKWAAAEIDLPDKVARVPGGDHTGGLNRDGRVMLYMPFEHELLSLGTEEAFWLRARLTKTGPPPPAAGAEPDPDAEKAAALDGTYYRSPSIRTLSIKSLGGRAHSTQGEPVDRELLGVSDGEPGQRYKVLHTPIIGKPGVGRIQVAGDPIEWAEVDNFADSDATARDFTWDRTTGEVQFGPEVRYRDGTVRQHGMIPARNAEVHIAPYQYGGGAIGNVGAGKISVLKSSIPYIERVDNHKKARGGVDPETIDNAKKRGPLTLVTGDRAVSARDYMRLTKEASTDVARSFCYRPTERAAFNDAMKTLHTLVDSGSEAGHQALLDAGRAVVDEAPSAVQVLVVPSVDVAPKDLRLDDLRLSDELVETIREFLDDRRTLGTWVDIRAPRYVGASVAARIDPAAGYDPDVVGEACRSALYRFIDPVRGGPEGNGWPFGMDLNIGILFQLLSAVPGVEEVKDVLLFPSDIGDWDREPEGRGVDRLELAPTDLFASVRHYVLILDEETL